MFFNLSRQIKSEVSYSTMKKSHNKRLLALASILPVVVFLAGCASKKPITAHSTGFWDHYVVWNVVRAIEGLSHIFGNNYGWGIVVFTIIIRIIILPLMIFQLRSSRKMARMPSPARNWRLPSRSSIRMPVPIQWLAACRC